MGNAQCTLDHFYISQHFVLTCRDAVVLHHTQNTSDHSVIYCKFRCDVDRLSGPACDSHRELPGAKHLNITRIITIMN